MNNMTINKEEFKEQLANNVKSLFRKTVKTASNVELYKALVFTIRSYISDNWVKTHDAYDSKGCKVVCYLSMEFLMGRFLGNAVLNMCANNTVSEALEELGIDYNALEDVERDPGLGNGGLGRLAACFLDSLSTLELPAYGCGIRYHYGIFEQKIENGYQVEKPDNWLKDGDVWGVERQEYAVDVNFFGDVKAVKKENGEYKFIQENCQTIVAIPYDYPVVGYGNKTVNTLRLWDAQPKAGFDLKSFNAGDYSKAVEQENMVLKKEIIEKLNAINAQETPEEDADNTIRELMKEWNTIGHVPFKEKDKLYKQYHAIIDKLFDKLNLSASQKKLSNFKSNIGKEGNIYREREKLVRAYENMKNEIQTYENNLGFLTSSSKKGSNLVTEMNRKVEKLKADLELILKKIEIIDQSMSKE